MPNNQKTIKRGLWQTKRWGPGELHLFHNTLQSREPKSRSRQRWTTKPATMHRSRATLKTCAHKSPSRHVNRASRRRDGRFPEAYFAQTRETHRRSHACHEAGTRRKAETWAISSGKEAAFRSAGRACCFRVRTAASDGKLSRSERR